jgi:hypothetical protein
MVKVADEVWIATALLHTEQPKRGSFPSAEIVDRAYREGLHKPLRPGVQIHVSQHCVANKRPNPGNYRMLYDIGGGHRRLYRHTDESHPYREGGKTMPARYDIPEKYWYLLDWYSNTYDRDSGDVPNGWGHPAGAGRG